jgi:hypothetical protein
MKKRIRPSLPKEGYVFCIYNLNSSPFFLVTPALISMFLRQDKALNENSPIGRWALFRIAKPDISSSREERTAWDFRL